MPLASRQSNDDGEAGGNDQLYMLDVPLNDESGRLQVVQGRVYCSRPCPAYAVHVATGSVEKRRFDGTVMVPMAKLLDCLRSLKARGESRNPLHRCVLCPGLHVHIHVAWPMDCHSIITAGGCGAQPQDGTAK